MHDEHIESLRRYCLSVAVAIFALNCAVLIPPALAQQTSTPPTIACDLMEVEASPDGIFIVGNLDRIRLEVELDGREWSIERLKFSGVQVPWDDPREPNIKVTVDSLSDTKQDIPVRINPFGGGRKYNTHRLSTVVEIPISEEEKRKQFDQYYLRVLESLDPNDAVNPNDPASPKILDLLENKRDDAYLYLRGLHFEHKPGLYRITCSYRSAKPDFWNGEIYSDPVLVRIVYEMAFYDQPGFLRK